MILWKRIPLHIPICWTGKLWQKRSLEYDSGAWFSYSAPSICTTLIFCSDYRRIYSQILFNFNYLFFLTFLNLGWIASKNAFNSVLIFTVRQKQTVFPFYMFWIPLKYIELLWGKSKNKHLYQIPILLNPSDHSYEDYVFTR